MVITYLRRIDTSEKVSFNFCALSICLVKVLLLNNKKLGKYKQNKNKKRYEKVNSV